MEKINIEKMVSVVIPNYNYSNYISECINSVLAQTYRYLEIIVVDDGSTDDSVEIIKKYGDSVKLICQKNRHLSAARNTGVLASKGEWIAFLDSDDIWHPQKIEIQINALEKHPDWFYVGAAPATEEFVDYTDQPVNEKESVLIDFLTLSPMSGSDAIIKSSCFKDIGLFNEKLRTCEDKDMWLRLASKYRGGVVDAKLWRYRYHGAQMNRNAKLMMKTRKNLLNRFANDYRLSFCLRRIAYAHHFYESAISFRDDEKEPFSAIFLFFLSIMYYPFSYNKKITTKLRIKSLCVSIRLALFSILKRKKMDQRF